MCSLILLRDLDPALPLLLGMNRDEDPGRPTEPPRRRDLDGRAAICPLDLVHGGTWLGVNDVGLHCAVTNQEGREARDADASRGLLGLAALAAGGLDEAERALRARLASRAHRPGRIVLADATRTRVLRFDDGGLEVREDEGRVLFLTSRHGTEGLVLDALDDLARRLSAPVPAAVACRELLALLAGATARTVPDGEPWPLCRRGPGRRTVASSALAWDPEAGLDGATWLHAAGNPCDAEGYVVTA
ncbi:MAG: NRDE family protein [Planctomycetota bacterium]